MVKKIRVTIWNENRHEKRDEPVRKLYPEGMHGAIGSYLAQQGFDVKTTTLDDPEAGYYGVIAD